MERRDLLKALAALPVLSVRDREAIKAAMSAAFPGLRVVVLSEGAKLQVVRGGVE